MAKIVFDCSMLSEPYRLKRCTYQLMHMALAAIHLGHDAVIVSTPTHIAQHGFLHRVSGVVQMTRPSCDIYVAKSDSFYIDRNWDIVRNIDAFKVCLCNSDRCFRESGESFGEHKGHPVQTRCDLYMPVNHTRELIEQWDHKVIPAAHPIDPRMYELFYKSGLYKAYIADDVQKLRSIVDLSESGKLGFMGAQSPRQHRFNAASEFPDWVEFNWRSRASSLEYIQWMMARRGCLDLRGYGDKSLRFTEAAIFGRTIVKALYPSDYHPKLVHNRNCVIYEPGNVKIDYNRERWLQIAEQATADYLTGWSILAQVRNVVRRAASHRPQIHES